MNESQMVARIRKRYPSPAWAVLQQVRNQTGYKKSRVRTADAMALSLYPSNGLALHGFEIKVSASDLRKEILDPSKAAEFSEYCDYWWVAISDESLMKGVEIPEAWGVLCASGQSLKIVRQAPKCSPKPMDIGLVCGLIRKAAETSDEILKGMVPHADVQKLVDERLESSVESRVRRVQTSYDELKSAVDEFESASGLSIRDRWRGQKTSQAVKHVMEHGENKVIEMARYEAERAKRYADKLAAFVAGLDQVEVAQA